MKITRNPHIRNGAFILEGTRLTVIDILYSLKRGDIEELEITNLMLKVVTDWLNKSFIEVVPANVKKCLVKNLREIKPNSKCLSSLIGFVRYRELRLKEQELVELLGLILKGKKPEEEGVLRKWYERFMRFAKEEKKVQDLVEDELLRTLKELKVLEDKKKGDRRAVAEL